jgi:hypothetical protein
MSDTLVISEPKVPSLQYSCLLKALLSQYYSLFINGAPILYEASLVTGVLTYLRRIYKI